MTDITCRRIALSKGLFALVDVGDYDWLNQWKWCSQAGINGFEYAHRKMLVDGRYVSVMMHRLILGLSERNLLGDHINGDTLDNRRSNLRVATASENCTNSCLRKDNKSGLKGVCVDSHSKKWKAQIQVHGKKMHLGIYETPEAAHVAYSEAAAKYHGKFVRQGTVQCE